MTPEPEWRIRWSRLAAIALVIAAVVVWRSSRASIRSTFEHLDRLLSDGGTPNDRLAGVVVLLVIVLALLGALRLILEHRRNTP